MSEILPLSVALCAFSAVSLGFVVGVLYGQARTRRDWQPLISWATEHASRPLALTVTQPAHAPGTFVVSETPPAVPIDPSEPWVLDKAEQERRKIEETAAFVQRAAQSLGTGGYEPGTLAPPVASRVILNRDPLVENLVVEPALAVE